MLITKHKKLLWVIVFWFALLQTVTPFIHAHMEADSAMQGHGLHMHAAALTHAVGDQHQHQHVLTEHTSSTVGVNAAVMEDVDPMPLPLFILLFVLSLPLVAMRRVSFCLIQFPFAQFLLRSISRPRAPPLL